MKKLKCTMAAVLATAITVLTCGCSGADMTWSYKDDQTTLSIGTYIYYEYSAYQQASKKVSDSNGDFLSEEFTNDDDETMTARDYIASETDLACKNYLNVEKKFSELGLSLTEEELAAAKQNASSGWSYNKTLLEGYGVSQESFTNAYGVLSAKYEKIFRTMYGTGGEKAVSESDLSTYFTDNYTNYSYFSVPLYNSTTDESGNAASTAKSDEDIAKIKTSLDTYAEAINKGEATFEDEAKAYMTDYNVTTDPSKSDVAVLADSGLGDEVITAYGEMSEKQAQVIKVGTDNSKASYYFLYKAPITDKVSTLSSDSDLHYKVLVKMKAEDYIDYMNEAAKAVECEKNQAAIDKYGPEKFITYATEPAASSSKTTSSAAQ